MNIYTIYDHNQDKTNVYRNRRLMLTYNGSLSDKQLECLVTALRQVFSFDLMTKEDCYLFLKESGYFDDYKDLKPDPKSSWQDEWNEENSIMNWDMT